MFQDARSPPAHEELVHHTVRADTAGQPQRVRFSVGLPQNTAPRVDCGTHKAPQASRVRKQVRIYFLTCRLKVSKN